MTSLPNPPSHGDDDVPSGDVDKADDDSDDDRNGDFLRIFGVSPCLLFPVKVAVTGRIQSHTITPLCRATPPYCIASHRIAPPLSIFTQSKPQCHNVTIATQQ